MDRSWMPTVAGVLTIITGCFAILGFFLLICFALVFHNAPDFPDGEFVVEFIDVAFAIGAAGSLLFGSVAVFGGVSSEVTAVDARTIGNCGEGEGEGSAECDNK